VPDIEYDYAHVPTIWRFSQSRKFIRGLMGPFGSGKSSGCVVELVQWAARQPAIDGARRSRFAVVRNTYRQLSDTSIKTWLDWLPDGQFGRFAKSDHNFYLRMPIGDGTVVESEILFRALDHPDHVSNLLSLELTGAWVNEAREIPSPIIKALQGRVGRYPAVRDGGCVDPGLIFDTNPPPDDSWFFRMFEVDRPDNCELFRQPSGRSPQAENLPNLPPEYYANQMKGADDDYIRVYVDGEYGFVKDGKPVYPEYSDALHCAEVGPIKGVPILVGWDFGLMPAAVFTQLSPEGRWLILDELCGDDIGISTFTDCVLEVIAKNFQGLTFKHYGDPAGQARTSMTADKDAKPCYDILRGKGIAIEPGWQNLTIRLEAVRKPLNTLRDGKPQFQLSPRCEMLRKGFLGRYQYRRVKVSGAAERYHPEPEKNEYSHPHDALQYVATRVFGDAVRGREEQRKQWSRPIEELYAARVKQMRANII
jgi:hypothetical protein